MVDRNLVGARLAREWDDAALQEVCIIVLRGQASLQQILIASDTSPTRKGICTSIR